MEDTIFSLLIIFILLIIIFLLVYSIPLVKSIIESRMEIKYLDAHGKVIHNFGELWENYNRKILRDHGYDASITFMNFVSEAQRIIFAESDEIIPDTQIEEN
jgi:hypothetical protein